MIDYAVVALFGLCAGTAELLSRYRDAPKTAIGRWPGLAYLAVNALAGVGGLAVVELLDLQFGLEPGEKLRWVRVLVAGFSSVALFRSSLFTVRAGDKDVPIGPAAALQAILATLDRAVDRKQAEDRDEFVGNLESDVPNDANRLRFLGAYCLGLMQNVPAGEQKQLEEQINTIILDRRLTPRDRLVLACLQLMAVVGHGVLSKAIQRMKSEPPAPAEEESVPAPPPVSELDDPPEGPSNG